jgi:hypothetical protein
MNSLRNIIKLEVLVNALARQTEPLPESLQQHLTEIGRALQVNPTKKKAIELCQLIEEYEPLEREYNNSLVELDRQYRSQERTKSIDTTFSMTSGLDELSIESFLLPANDWVAAAKQLTNRLSSPPTSAKFWDKTDRLAVTTAGGIAIGSAIAQLPGAIIGGLLGAGYGWYLGFRKPTDRKSDRASAPIDDRAEIENGSNARSIEVDNDPNLAIDFGDLSTEQLAMMAQSATQDAVKDLHHKGISTYGMQDGIIYETNPISNTKSVVEEHHQS